MLASWRASASICSTSRVCTVDARHQSADGELARAVVAGALQALHLQLECGQRRTQLVRRVGHEVCFCASKACRTRSNSRLSSCTSGRTSSGSFSSLTGERSSAWREATWVRTRATGASERLTTHHTTSISSGAISATGATVRSARVPAMCWRAAMSCATWITSPRVCIENTR